MAENLKVFDFELDPQDVQMIADLKGCVGFAADPDQITF
jgi:diketogulonate reductase-like aldo/keto reductase